MAVVTAHPSQATESPQCLTSNLGWLLAHASHVLSTELVAAMAPLGLGPRGYCVLSAASQEEHTQTELAHLKSDKMRLLARVNPAQQNSPAAWEGYYQDVFWALINSNEFILNH